MRYEGGNIGEDPYAPDDDFTAAQSFLGMLGRGRPALPNRVSSARWSSPRPAVDARGQHLAIAGYINSELSKLVVVRPQRGGRGRRLLRARHLPGRQQGGRVGHRRAAQRGHPPGPDRSLHRPGERLRHGAGLRCVPAADPGGDPRCYRVMDRRIDPVQRLSMFVAAKKELGADIDLEQMSEELNIRLMAKPLELNTEGLEAQPDELELDQELDQEEPDSAEEPTDRLPYRTTMNEIFLYGPVGGWLCGFTAADLALALHSMGDVKLRVHSEGGDAMENIAVANVVRPQGKVVVQVDGLCASAATPVLAGR